MYSSTHVPCKSGGFTEETLAFVRQQCSVVMCSTKGDYANKELTSMTLPEVVPTAMLLSFLFTVTARTASHALPSCKA